MSLTTVEVQSFSGPSIVQIASSDQPEIVYINQGPTGPTGLNSVTTSTSTNLAGYIFGNGTNIAGATSGSTSATASTIAIRDASSNVSAGAFLLPNGSFTGTIDNATLTGARAWTMPDKTGYVALTQNANGSVTNSEVYVKASVSITAGNAVYISGASGANKLVTLAQANIESTSSKTLGIALQNIAANGFGYVVTDGDLTGLSINLGSGHGVVEGDPIWLSPTTAGGLLFGLANKPTAPNHSVFLGYVTRITGNTLVDIFVKVQNGFELDELHDVAISNLSDGQVLTWENSTQLWKNKVVSVGSSIYSDSLNVTYGGNYPITGRAILTTPQRNDALIGATSGSQSMTARTGKWIEGFTYENFNNRVIDGMTSISFPDLVGATGTISIGAPFGSSISCTSISFPELKVAGALTTASSTVLSSLSFPKLEVITNGLSIGQALVTTLDFPELKSLGGAFTFGSLTNAIFSSLTSITFPKLFYAGSFGLYNSGSNLNIPNLTSFSVPLLAESSSIVAVAGNFAKLKTVNYPALKDVASSFTLSNGGANAVNSVDFSSLENIGGTANLLSSSSSLASLNSVSYPALRNVGDSLSISSGINSNAGTTSVLIGPNLKHVNGNISVGATRLDAHLNWVASTRYVAYLSLDIPVSSFVVSNSSSTVTVTSNNHGLAAGDIITITGLDGSVVSVHPANANRATVATADANTFTYLGAISTSIIPAGTALVQREASTVFPTGKNGRKYIATTNGSSGSTEPTWPTTLGATIADSGVTWRCVERSHENLLSRFEALNGTNDTYTYGANRLIAFSTGQSITGVAAIAATTGVVTANAHGLTTGTQIMISGGTGTALPYNGIWTITVTGINTFTLNELSGSGWTPVAASGITLSLGSPQFSGNVKVPTSIASTAADVHHVLSSTGLANVNSSTGTALPVFVAGVYYDKGNLTNGFKRYECAENSWSIWYSTGLKRWAITPNSVVGTDAQVSNYAYTQAGVPISSISATGNPCTITTSATHGYSGSSSSRFTVLIEGNTNASVNGLWTATFNNVTTNFTIPVNVTVAGTGGTVTVLNQSFVNGPLLSSTVGAPVQAALMTVNMPTHGYSNGDFVHCSGAQGTHAFFINNLNTAFANNANNSAITVTDPSNFTFIRHGSTQPFIGTLTLTQQPLIRRSSNATEGFNLTNKLRARGVTTSMLGMV